MMESTDVGDGVVVASSSALRPGDSIGPYRVEGTIGSGAMGVVYAATHRATRQRAAVKLMHPRGYYGNATQTDAWLRNEAAALSCLAHPNVVSVFGVGAAAGRPYLAMELVEGRTLGQWLAECDRGWEVTLRVCMEAARGLAAVHRAGVMHGDFKPDNVMVAADGRVLVMDFGLARTMSSDARADTQTSIPAIGDRNERDDDETQRTQSNRPSLADAYDTHDDRDRWDDADAPNPEACGSRTELRAEDTGRRRAYDRLRRRAGTPAYMAPELLAGVGGDDRSDQFSLCVTIYRALFGQRPYGGRTPGEIAFRLSRGDLRPPPPGRKIPAWLHAAITRGLAIEAADRWPSVDALLGVLQRGVTRTARQRLAIAAVSAMMVVLAIAVSLRLALA